MAILRALVLLGLASVVLFLLPRRREDEHSAWTEPDDGIPPADPYLWTTATGGNVPSMPISAAPSWSAAPPTVLSWSIGSTLHRTH